MFHTIDSKAVNDFLTKDGGRPLTKEEWSALSLRDQYSLGEQAAVALDWDPRTMKHIREKLAAPIT